jgi:hypothetical protein
VLGSAAPCQLSLKLHFFRIEVLRHKDTPELRAEFDALLIRANRYRAWKKVENGSQPVSRGRDVNLGCFFVLHPIAPQDA